MPRVLGGWSFFHGRGTPVLLQVYAQETLTNPACNYFQAIYFVTQSKAIAQ